MTEKYLSPNLEQTVSYIIYTDGTTVYAMNGSTGKIDYSGTDAATVIQNATDALTDGGKILFKKGIYDGEGHTLVKLSGKSNILLEGEGYGTILTSNNCDVISLGDPDPTSDIIIRNMKVIQTGTEVTTYEAIDIDDSENIVVENCYLKADNKCIDSHSNTDYAAKGIRISNCVIDGNDTADGGIVILGNYGGVIVIGNYIKNCDFGIDIYNGAQAVIMGNIIENNTNRGINIKNTSGVVVRNNYIRLNDKEGIWMLDASNNIIDGNLIYDNGEDGIRVKGVTKDNLFANNNIFNNVRYGLNIYDMGEVNTLIFNKFDGNYDNFYDPFGYLPNWKLCGNIGYTTENSGTAIFSGDGSTTSFNIPHGLAATPTNVRVSPATSGATGVYSSRYDADATNIVAKFKTAPPSPTIEDSNSGNISGTSSTISDDGKSWTDDEWIGHYVRITGGTGNGQCRRIIDNDATVLTISPEWDAIPDNTSTYDIIDSAIEIEWEAEV